MLGEVHVVSVPIPDPGADNKQLYLFKAPDDAYGGGITIVDAFAQNNANTGSGTTFTYQLLKYSSAGTPALNGTISAVIGGTTAPWVANVPKEFTISTPFVDAGEWVVLDYQEITAGSPTISHVNIHYVMGK